VAYEDYRQKKSVVLVYTGEGKGKTSASLGLLARALGSDLRVAFVQFIKYWEVGEHQFLKQINEIYGEQLVFYKGGKGFYKAGEASAKGVSDAEHKKAARETYDFAFQSIKSGDFDLVICDEINNAVHDGLLSESDLKNLINSKSPDTSLCLTGRDFPEKLLEYVDIATNMTKLKHHFDDKFLANRGIDY
jgi:cob(I)alamin adenosyltransferase